MKTSRLLLMGICSALALASSVSTLAAPAAKTAPAASADTKLDTRDRRQMARSEKRRA